MSSSSVVSTMYTIGEFAALGRVSVRMLRHYDAIGLLVPADVDDRTGYRRYAPAQLSPLLRIAQLRDLGCGLDDAAEVLRSDDERAALKRVLERRRLDLVASLTADRARLARLDEELRHIEGEPSMTTIEYRRLEPVTVYAASGIVAGGEDVPATIDRILPPLHDALESSGVDYREPGTFWYESIPDTEDMRVWVSWIAGGEPVPGDGWQIVELPGAERAAVTQYRGDMAGIGAAWNQFMQAVVADGATFSAPCREVYLQVEPLPQSEWLTELQQPVG
ncbi:MerR family transcriptional regulator [Microbacterium ureisolvens]|uniref:MerR family transcriptional regulator n=1 Tax=Microbacterium ureisolvens TaxID=2781186 RepID=UPI00363C92F2